MQPIWRDGEVFEILWRTPYTEVQPNAPSNSSSFMLSLVHISRDYDCTQASIKFVEYDRIAVPSIYPA